MCVKHEGAFGSLNALTGAALSDSVESVNRSLDMREKSNGSVKIPKATSTNSIWEILVPSTDICGQTIPVSRHREWDHKVRVVTGGLTILPPVRGHWVAPNEEVIIERMIPVRIACTKKQVESIADMTAAFYEQQSVMYYCISNEVYVKSYWEPPCPLK